MSEKSQDLTHVDSQGKASMVDIGEKRPVKRFARACGKIKLNKKTISLISQNAIKKGDVLRIAQIAGIQAAKLTPNLIPLCHPIAISHVDVQANLSDESVDIYSTVKCIGRTGVEMEALTAVNVALLTVYDMCKAVDKEMVMSNIQLLEKIKKEV